MPRATRFNGDFGRVTTARDPRIHAVALRLTFLGRAVSEFASRARSLTVGCSHHAIRREALTLVSVPALYGARDLMAGRRLWPFVLSSSSAAPLD